MQVCTNHPPPPVCATCTAQHLLRGPWSHLLTDCLHEWLDQAEGGLKETRRLVELASVGSSVCGILVVTGSLICTDEGSGR